MKRHFSLGLGWVLATGLALAALPPAQAQSRTGAGAFTPVILVNDLGISGYEIDQRMRFLQLFGTKGDLRKQAEEALIEDRLQLWRARSLGISLPKDAVSKGMAEFAARVNLSTEDFLKAIGQAGIDPQSYRDFVIAGMIWREVVKAEFASRVQVSGADIDRALALEAPQAAQEKVLLSEVVIRVWPGREAEAMAKARRAAAARTEADFAALARELSSSPTAAKGGRLDWMSVLALPPQVRETVGTMRPGRTSGVIETPNSLTVFFLRGIDAGGKVAPGAQAVGYATLLLGATGAPETAALAASAEAQAKRCDDLYSVARKLPPEWLDRVEAARPGQVPADIARTLSRLDVGETQVLRRGGNDVLVMLCDRGRAVNADLGETGPSRDGTRGQIENARISAMADRLMARMKAEAVIVRK